jgi:hypothetical protein
VTIEQSFNVSRTGERDRDPPIRDFFPKTESTPTWTATAECDALIVVANVCC